jgi:hypothetical protein
MTLSYPYHIPQATVSRDRSGRHARILAGIPRIRGRIRERDCDVVAQEGPFCATLSFTAELCVSLPCVKVSGDF